MQTKLQAIATKLATLDCDVFHYNAPENHSAPYVVWQEDDRVDLEAGNTHTEKAWQGTVHLFTHTEFDTLNDDIETLLENNFLGWYLDIAEYDETTDVIHTSWVFNYA